MTSKTNLKISVDQVWSLQKPVMFRSVISTQDNINVTPQIKQSLFLTVSSRIHLVMYYCVSSFSMIHAILLDS